MFEKYEEGVIDLIEKLNIDRPVMTSYDIITQFNSINSKLKSEKSKNKEIKSEIIKEIDLDNDGFISGIDLITFLLNKFHYKSTKIAYKYIKRKIISEFKSDTLIFFQNTFPYYNNGEKEIEENELENFLFQHFSIQKTITKEIINEISDLYSHPIKIKYLILQIEKINETLKNISERNEIFEEETTEILQDAINNFNNEEFEKELTKISLNFIELNKKKNIPMRELEKKFEENLKTVLEIKNKENDEKELKYNFQEYKEKIIKSLRLKPNIGYSIFMLLKKKGDDEDYIQLNDIKDLLLSYIPENKIEKGAEEIIYEIQKNGISIKLPLEEIPFNPKGKVSINEIYNSLELYYPNIEKNSILKIINLLDDNKIGFVTYKKIQSFFAENLNNDKFSYVTELKHIMSFFIENELINNKSEDYFFSDQFSNYIKSYFAINEDYHNKFFENICTSDLNMKELFEYCLRKQGRINDYDINLLCKDLNYYFIDDNDINTKYNEVNLFDLPNVDVINNVLNNLNFGENGKIEINEFLSNFHNDEAKNNLGNLINENQNGYLTINELFNKLNEIYKTNFTPSLNIVKNNILLKYQNKNNFILNIKRNVNNNDLNKVSLSKNEFYSKFHDDFLNNDILYNKFYSEYKNSFDDKININSYYKFIFNENIPKEEKKRNKRNKRKGDKCRRRIRK